MPQKTVLHDRHVALGGRMVDFHGWLLPVQYEGVLAEHRHCRSAAALFDTSHMGQILIVTGDPDAISRITTQDAGKLGVGRGKYGFLLNEQGGILDDTVLIRLGDDTFFLVVNAGTQQQDFNWVTDNLAGSAEVVNRSAEGWSKIDLQGPQSAAVLAPLTDANLAELGYFRATRAKVCGQECILSRTGYTGELGYEMFAPGERIVRMFDAMLADERVRPAGLGARDSLRLEMCYPLHGEDIDSGTNPVEADLEFALKSEIEYIGSKAVAQVAQAGPKRRLAAFASRTRRRFAHGDRITSDDRQVGTVTSGAFSPSLEVSIGMGYVEPALAAPGTELIVETERASIPVAVGDKPLYKNGTCRTKQVL